MNAYRGLLEAADVRAWHDEIAVVTSGRYSDTKFLETQSLSRIVKEALQAAERDGKVTHADKEFFRGRKKEIDAVYTKFRVLPPEVVDQLRASHKACEPYLGARAGSEAEKAGWSAADVRELAAAVRSEIASQPGPSWGPDAERIPELERQVAELRAQLKTK